MSLSEAPMSESNNPAPSGTVAFMQFHQPSLKPGTYAITVAQQVATNETPQPKIPTTTFSATRSFSIAGERFSLDPAEISAVYPPDGSLGDHSNVVPHLMLTRSTLPWERQADPQDASLPWLTLLLFTEDEAPVATIISLDALQNSASTGVIYPSFTLETGQSAADRVSVIDVPASTLRTLLPTPAALGLMAHVRQARDADDQPTGSEQAVVIGNRLPGPNQINSVFLVSLEGRYTSAGFDFQGAADADLVRFVVLASWRFAAPPQAQQSFTNLLLELDHSPSTLRLPPNANPLAEQYAAQGYALIPHLMRAANQTASWYRGPLGVGTHTATLPLPAPAADALVRYDTATGLFDVSYAAAWELGRLLILQSKQVSTSLYSWKRAHIQQQKVAKRSTPKTAMLSRTISPKLRSRASADLPADVRAWFAGLRRLQGVPFNYLVPDEAMLPSESIRFFQLDVTWMACLFDGALSIGRATSGDLQAEQSITISPPLLPLTPLSGFVLRSAVVAGWPGLLVNATDADQQPLEQLRLERISANVLLGVFVGELNTLLVHLQPETLHFGFDAPTEQYPQLHKQLRATSGAESDQVLASLPWQDAARQVLAIDTLSSSMQQLLAQTPWTSAQFAFQMIEGVEAVQFQQSAS